MTLPLIGRLPNSEVLRSIAGSIVLKAGTVTANFALIALLGATLDAHDFGAFSMVFSAAGLFAIVAVVGQQVLLMRRWSELSASNDLPRLRASLEFSSKVVACGLLIVSGSFLLVALFFLKPLEAVAATFFLASLSLTNVTSHLIRSSSGIFVADATVVLAGMVPPIVALIIGHILGHPIGMDLVLMLMAAGGIGAASWHLLLFRQTLKKLHPTLFSVEPSRDSGELVPSTVRLWASQSLEVCNQYLDVLIVGVMLDPASAGGYFVITRLANMFSTLSTAIYLSTTRHLPDLFFGKKQSQMERLLDTTAVVVVLAVGIGLLGLVAAGGYLLQLFGVDHQEWLVNLLVLSASTAFVSAMGPAPILLNLAGHEQRYLNTLAVGVFIRLVGFALLVASFGVSGAVTAVMLSSLWLGFRLRWQAMALTGLDVSVMRLCGLVHLPGWKSPAASAGE